MKLIDADALFEVIKKSMAENPHKEETQRAMHIHEHKYFLTLLAGIPTIQPEPQWIPVSERMPEESGWYICTCRDGVNERVTFLKWQKRLKQWEKTGTRSYWKVIAWMPLPEPYNPNNE